MKILSLRLGVVFVVSYLFIAGTSAILFLFTHYQKLGAFLMYFPVLILVIYIPGYFIAKRFNKTKPNQIKVVVMGITLLVAMALPVYSLVFYDPGSMRTIYFDLYDPKSGKSAEICHKTLLEKHRTSGSATFSKWTSCRIDGDATDRTGLKKFDFIIKENKTGIYDCACSYQWMPRF